jgi:hypothetical protein
MPSAEPTLAISRIYNVQLQPGETIEVNVTISDVSNLASVRVDLAWDPYVLKVTTGDPHGWTHPITEVNYSIFEGSFLRSFSNVTKFLVNDVNNNDGTIEAIFVGILEQGKTASGSGVLATINFTCVNPGITTIEVIGPREGHASIQSGDGMQIPHKEIYGLVTDMGPPPIWTESGFQVSFITVEIIVITVASAVIYVKRRPKRIHKETEEEIDVNIEKLVV